VLKQRILTALVLAPLAIGALFFLPLDLFMLSLDLVLLAGAWEWSALSGLKKTGQRVMYVFTHVLALAVMHLMAVYWLSPPVFVVPLLMWALALWWVGRFPVGGLWQVVNVRLLLGFLVLLPVWLAFLAIKAHPWSDQLLLVLLLLVWGADVGAYFAGKRFGKTRLAAVSPGKTREGMYGGLFTCAVVALGASLSLELDAMVAVYFVVLALVTGLISVLGDLFESMLKRHCGMKDSGSLLPGHGGVMDRIDSLTAAAPMFALGVQLLPV